MTTNADKNFFSATDRVKEKFILQLKVISVCDYFPLQVCVGKSNALFKVIEIVDSTRLDPTQARPT